MRRSAPSSSPAPDPGFSVFAGDTLSTDDPQQVERGARYIARPAVATGSLRRQQDGSLQIDTPPDPRNGGTARTLDPLDWIHPVTAQLPDPCRHPIRYWRLLQ